MSFHVGQKVICVDADCTNIYGARELTRGAIYVVRWSGAYTHPGHEAEPSIRVEGIVRDPGEFWHPDHTDVPFIATRFRPLIERKTDISIFNKIARDASERSPARIGENA